MKKQMLLMVLGIGMLMLQGCEKKSSKRVRKITDTNYSIISSNNFLNYKKTIDVRINNKMSKASLHRIAIKLKNQDSQSYDRIFICYYLPGMAVDSGAWATTHFNPTLEIKILELDLETKQL